jgi:hypothetical protein
MLEDSHEDVDGERREQNQETELLRARGHQRSGSSL